MVLGGYVLSAAGRPPESAGVGPTSPPDPDTADVRRVAPLPAAQQVEAVRQELLRRNPDFDGELTPRIENGVVVGVELSALGVRDVTPVRAFEGLQSFECRGVEGQGKLADLGPLRGLRLTSLDCNNTQVGDLAAVAGVPLTSLHVQHTRVTDLSPLRGMPLRALNLRNYPLRPARDGPILRSLERQEEVNSDPAADFLGRLGAEPGLDKP